MTRDELAELAASLRAEGKRVVFTNGVFDILHVGHVRYLQQARSLGDALLVGINSDASVRRLKGPTRPINSEEERAEVIAALSCVAGTCIFTEDTPHALIEAVRPNIHAKGGDYKTPEALPETPLVRSLGGDVVILPLVDGRSTTRLIERLELGGPSEETS
jgi:rfaE bifunctional protein nucleotidyltransferase chain/domain